MDKINGMDKLSILVVDDDKEIVNAISINLENEGYRVFKAYDGLQALDTINTQSIQLILLDIMMPKLDFGYHQNSPGKKHSHNHFVCKVGRFR